MFDFLLRMDCFVMDGKAVIYHSGGNCDKHFSRTLMLGASAGSY